MQINKLLTTALLTLSAHAGTLLEVGPGGSAYFASAPIGFNAAFASGFSLDQTYTNINVEAMLGATATYPAGHAFLMRSIGTNTTSAQQIDSRILNFPTLPNLQNGSFQSLFNGLTLAAGTYYLVIETPVANDTIIIGQFLGDTVNTAPGISLTGNFARVPAAAYAPSTAFVNYTVSNFRIRVSGDANVPEPATVALTAASLLALAFHKRRS
ncbi:MAG: PEP-CTERM sorting domain-containing protein [Acidobacteria bacterium]|nr:PEP-CTERM sorting domain-containing protein [Acidobacteriota bacterium]